MEHPGAEPTERAAARKCAWCGQPMAGPVRQADVEPAPDGATAHHAAAGATVPHDPASGGSICKACAGQLKTYRKPVLVVSREWARLYEDVAALLASRPDIQVIIDRRHAARDGSGAGEWTGPNRRATDEPLGLK